jgi:uncharacterized protein
LGRERAIEFRSEERVLLRGWLRLPEGEGPHPLVIMAHGFGGLKEWSIPVVADVFVEAGLAAMAFDYRNFGDSEGTPREEVDSPGQIEDWRSAVTYATTLEEVDPERIGIWGTSLGGKNVLIVAGLERRIRAVVAQVPAIDWADTVLHHQNNAVQRQELLAAIDADRRARFLGAEPEYAQRQVAPGTETAYFFATLTESDKKNWKGRLTVRSYEPNVASNALPFMPMISPTPLLMILAEHDVITPLPGQLDAYAAAHEPKELFWLKGRHYDVYSPPLRDAAAGAARDFFTGHLLH